MKILTGIESPSSGNIRFPFITSESLNSSHYPHILYNSIGYCPQYDALWEKISARQHVALYARIRGCPYNELNSSVESVLDEVGIKPDERDLQSRYLSGGNKRRLMLAVATVGRPKLIFLDGNY
jgi:ATP-binding cassette, subfamily A (ABC1), member 3